MRPADERVAQRKLRTRLVPEGVEAGGEVVPLWVGAAHYFRLDPRSWRPALARLRDVGFRFVDTYVPWGVHETAPGEADFGARDPRLDVAAFLRIAHDEGLLAIVRPGPHVNAELTWFGLPERIVWDADCQARSPRGGPVILPMLPLSFPVPSYASRAFERETARWYAQVGRELAPLRWPDGPIALVQVDNEGAMYFRDGVAEQDHHPDAIALWHAFVRARYRTFAALCAAWGRDDVAWPPAPPPRWPGAGPIQAHLDWAAFQDHLVARSIGRMARSLAAGGLSELPTTHNVPMGHEAAPIDLHALSRSVDLVCLDAYARATPRDAANLARRTSEVCELAKASHHPPYGGEIGAGYAPYFPPIAEHDSIFALLASLAFGLRGFDVYMAVDRDRWIGAPIDAEGRERPFAAFFRALFAALDRVGFASLRRATPVRLVTPRSQRWLERSLSAFGALGGTFLASVGAGVRERCLEDELDRGDGPIAFAGSDALLALEQALARRGVPFAHVAGETASTTLAGARWVVTPTTVVPEPTLARALAAAGRRGAKVTLLGSGSIAPSRAPERSLGRRAGAVPGRIDDLESLDEVVGRAIAALHLPAYPVDAPGVTAALHHDARGRAAALFVVQPGDEDRTVVVGGTGIGAAVDVLDGTRAVASARGLEVTVRARSVRLLAPA